MLTVTPAWNPVPASVTTVPPALLPEGGLTDVRVGAGAGGKGGDDEPPPPPQPGPTRADTRRNINRRRVEFFNAETSQDDSIIARGFLV
jgi:hypothetical protein